MLFLNDTVDTTTSMKEGTLPNEARLAQYMKDDEKTDTTE